MELQMNQSKPIASITNTSKNRISHKQAGFIISNWRLTDRKIMLLENSQGHDYCKTSNRFIM